MQTSEIIKLLEHRLAEAEAQLAKTESAHRAREKRQAFLLELSDALRPVSDARDIQKTTTRMVGTHLGVDRAMYAEVDGALGAETGTVHAQFVRPPASDGSATVEVFPHQFTFDQFGVHTMGARYRGEPLVVTDISSDPAFGAEERAAWQKAGVCAAIVAPLAKGGRLVAEFGIHCAQARNWTAEEVALVQEVAERTWATAERARAEAALRASEEKYRSLFQSMDEAYAVVEVLKDDAGDWVDFRFLDANPAFMDHTTMPYPVGKTATELLGKPNPRWTKLYGKALDTGKPMRIEETEHTLGRTFDLNIFSLDRRSNRVAVLFTNITERRRAEAALIESEKKYRSLFESMDQGYSLNEVVRDAEGHAVDIRYIEHNPALARLTGVPASEATGRLASEVFLGLDRYWIDILDRVVTSGVSEQVEHELSPIGRWYQSKFYPVGGDRCASLFDDITERKMIEGARRENEERQAFLLKLSDALRAEPDTDAVAYRALTLLSDHLNLDRCYITYYRPEDDEAVFPYQVGNDTVPPLPPSVRLSDFPEAYAEVHERTFVINDDFERRGLSETERANSEALGMRAMLASTLRKGAHLPLASMAAVSSRPRQWTQAEIALVEETAERTWSAIERARADATLRENEERLSLAVEIGALASWDWDVKSSAVTWNDSHFLMQGYGVDEVIPSFEAWLARVHPDDRDEALALIENARDRKIVFAHDFRSQHPDGRIVWCSARGRFFYGADGRAYRMIGVMEDITERVEAESALRKSEERFQQFAGASSSGLWIRKADTMKMEFVSPAVAKIYGTEPDAFTGDVERWAAMIVPEDRETALAHIEQALHGEPAVHEFRIRRHDGTFRWIRNTDFPLYDDEGHVERIGGIVEDVTTAKMAVEHQAVLLAELQHRVRNIMAIIRSTVVRSAHGAVDVENYKTSLAGRLLALARVQTLLTRQANAGGSLRSILESEIGAQAHSENRYELTGPEIMLSPKAVEVLTLAFHELSTNALKYGALSVNDGKVLVKWTAFEKREKPWLAIDWIEEGAPPQPPPTRRGFGSELIEAKIPYELRGTGKTTIEPGGAHCHIEFPLRNAESILETDAPAPTRLYGGTVDMTGAPDLTGKNVLVVEDDYYVASDTAAALRGAGADVLGPCPTEEDALRLLEDENPTAVVLDLNLGGGGPRFKIAHKLVKRGTPFIFLTGYDPDVIPEDLSHVLRLQKPVALRDVVEALSKL